MQTIETVVVYCRRAGDALDTGPGTPALRARLEPTIMLVVTLPLGLAASLAIAQDGLTDKIVMKGPGETSGFEVRYVYAVRFQARWLGLERPGPD
jgi:hypothetical protein